MVYLIDDEATKGWAEVFAAIINKVFGDLVTFDYLKYPNTISVVEFYNQAKETIANNNHFFILDNRLYNGYDCKWFGIDLLKEYGKSRTIVMHSADKDLGFIAAKYGAIQYMRKNHPEDGLNENTRLKNDLITLIHNIAVFHGLPPEMKWILM